MWLSGRLRWLCALLLITCWFATAARICSGQQSLAWQFRPQDRFRLVTSQDAAMIAAVGDKSVRMTHRTAVEVAWQTTDVDDDGVAAITQTVERIKIRLTSPAADDVVYDTASDEPAQGHAKQLAAAVDPLRKTEATMNVHVTGRVTNVQLSQNAEALPKQMTGPARAFSQFFTRAGVVELTGIAQLRLPDQPVSVGDRWDRQGETQTELGVFARRTSYERLGDETRDNRTLAKLSVSWTLAPVKQDAPRLPGEADPPAAPRIERQDNRGTILFDLEAGHPVEAVFQHRMTMAATVDEKQLTQEVASDVKVRITKLP